MFLLVLSYYVALYSLIFEIAEVVFAGHKADPGTSPTGTLSYRARGRDLQIASPAHNL
jgi:hypothetical protein